jgi:hypothetical protein
MTRIQRNFEYTPQLKRLLDQVERRQLHQGTCYESPRDWLVNWLATPFDDLNGRKPASFLDNEDFDLILVGLLAHLDPQTPAHFFHQALGRPGLSAMSLSSAARN